MTFFRAKQYAAGINTYSVCDFTVVFFFISYSSARYHLWLTLKICCRFGCCCLLFVSLFSILIFHSSHCFIFCNKTDIGCAFDCSCQKVNVQKMALISLSNGHIYSPHFLNVYQFYTLFLPFGFFLRFVARLFAFGALFFLLFSVLSFVVIENMYCEFYEFWNAANNNRIRFFFMLVATFRTEWMNVIVKAHSLTHFAILSSTSIYMPFGHCYFYNHQCFMSLRSILLLAIVLLFPSSLLYLRLTAYINCSPMMVHVRYTQPQIST